MTTNNVDAGCKASKKGTAVGERKFGPAGLGRQVPGGSVAEQQAACPTPAQKSTCSPGGRVVGINQCTTYMFK